MIAKGGFTHVAFALIKRNAIVCLLGIIAAFPIFIQTYNLMSSRALPLPVLIQKIPEHIFFYTLIDRLLDCKPQIILLRSLLFAIIKHDKMRNRNLQKFSTVNITLLCLDTFLNNTCKIKQISQWHIRAIG